MSTEIWVAIIGAVSGTIGLKLIEWILSRGDRGEDRATQYRTELREDVAALKKDLNKALDNLDVWKEKYYRLLEQFVVLQSQLRISMDDITTEVAELHILAGDPKELERRDKT